MVGSEGVLTLGLVAGKQILAIHGRYLAAAVERRMKRWGDGQVVGRKSIRDSGENHSSQITMLQHSWVFKHMKNTYYLWAVLRKNWLSLIY